MEFDRGQKGQTSSLLVGLHVTGQRSAIVMQTLCRQVGWIMLRYDSWPG